jgi:hypothetical protein
MATISRVLISATRTPAATHQDRSPVARSSSSCGSSTQMTGCQCASTPPPSLSRPRPTSVGSNLHRCTKAPGNSFCWNAGRRNYRCGVSSRRDRIARSGRQLYRRRRGVYPALVAQTAGRCNTASHCATGRLRSMGKVRPSGACATPAGCSLTCLAFNTSSYK